MYFVYINAAAIDGYQSLRINLSYQFIIKMKINDKSSIFPLLLVKSLQFKSIQHFSFVQIV